jgi:hypothetical protein
MSNNRKRRGGWPISRSSCPLTKRPIQRRALFSSSISPHVEPFMPSLILIAHRCARPNCHCRIVNAQILPCAVQVSRRKLDRLVQELPFGLKRRLLMENLSDRVQPTASTSKLLLVYLITTLLAYYDRDLATDA